MAYEITRLSDKGIVVLNLNGVFDTRQVLRDMTDAVAALSHIHPGRIYRIIDTRQMDLSFTSTTLRLIEDIRRATTSNDERLNQMFVIGKSRLMEIVRYSGMRVCIFSTLEDAVAQASTEIAYRVVSDGLSASHGSLPQAGQFARA
jgi:hypothetical protein